MKLQLNKSKSVDIIDNEIKNQPKANSVITVLAIGIFAYLTLISVNYLIVRLVEDFAITAGGSYIAVFMMTSTVRIIFTYSVVKYGFQQIPKHIKLGNGKQLVKWFLIVYIIVQFLQFLYSLIMFEILPTRYIDNASIYYDSKPVNIWFVAIESMLYYSVLIIIYIVYQQESKKQNEALNYQ